MEHPFASTLILPGTMQQHVSGAGNVSEFKDKLGSPEHPSPVIKPPVQTTLAIGEEGGGLGILF